MTESRLEVTCATVAATRACGATVAAHLRPSDIVVLTGDLGSGKTVFTKGVVEALGGDTAVTSPTFVLCHLYDTSPPVAHLDCWRLDDPAELIDLGLEDLVEAGRVLLIEWGHAAAARLGDGHLEVHFEVASASTAERAADGAPLAARRLIFSPSGAAWSSRLSALTTALEQEALVEVGR